MLRRSNGQDSPLALLLTTTLEADAAAEGNARSAVFAAEVYSLLLTTINESTPAASR